ncbi:MAG TPA: extensin family protein [Stellaceae bacterium]|nr:extensin family protein [Stellaceae bacterium]
MRRATLTAITLAVLVAGGGYLAGRFAPPRYSPLAPLDVRDDVVPLVTAVKLARARTDLDYCRRALATSAFKATPVAEISSKQCVLHDVERIAADRSPAFNAGFIATCPLAVDLALFVDHVVQLAAQRDMHSDVARIDQLGTFACRPIVGEGPTAELSQHASANAIDIAGFTFADGEKAMVAADWQGDDAKARFLHDVHDGACGIFPVVLSPDFNAAHRNHFHFDLSGFHFGR